MSAEEIMELVPEDPGPFSKKSPLSPHHKCGWRGAFLFSGRVETCVDFPANPGYNIHIRKSLDGLRRDRRSHIGLRKHKLSSERDSSHG